MNAVPAVRGWVRLGILWQLMEHGTATPSELSALLGCALDSVQRALPLLTGSGLLVVATARPGGKRLVYGLSNQGIELALTINQADWQGQNTGFVQTCQRCSTCINYRPAPDLTQPPQGAKP